MAFLLYTFVIYLIHLYTVSGRNAAKKNAENIEMSETKWYARVPDTEAETPSAAVPLHVIGDDDEEGIHHR